MTCPGQDFNFALPKTYFVGRKTIKLLLSVIENIHLSIKTVKVVNTLTEVNSEQSELEK